MLVPGAVEQRLIELEKALDDAYEDLLDAEGAYQQAKHEFDLGMAKARIDIGVTMPKATVQYKEDLALIRNEGEYQRKLAADALVAGARANVQRLRAKADIARSLGAGLRSQMEL